MQKLAIISAAASLTILGGCSNKSDIASAPTLYVGVPASLMERCVVRDVALNTTGDLVVSRNIYKKGFEICAARIDAIREHDTKVRAAMAAD